MRILVFGLHAETPVQKQREAAADRCDCRMQCTELQRRHPLEEPAEPANGDIGEKQAQDHGAHHHGTQRVRHDIGAKRTGSAGAGLRRHRR